MPTYEYECRTCGYTFERVQNMSDEPVKTCPECGESVRRLIFGGSGVIFKGSGFYVNDSKGKNSAAPKADKAAKADASGSTDSTGASSPPAGESSAAKPAEASKPKEVTKPAAKESA